MLQNQRKRIQSVESEKSHKEKCNLAIEGVVVSDFSITPRNEVEIDDGDEVGFEELDQVIDNEVCAVWA